jgi:very-short-patch-repair endonuclease
MSNHFPLPPLRGRSGWGVVPRIARCHHGGMAHSRATVPLARKLRLTPTDAEIRLWSRLRRKQLEGFRFRRQHPLGPYVADFFCAEAKLVVEVDGGQHADDGDTRTRWLAARGYRVIRFWNNDVLANTEGVLQMILEALRA